MQNCSDQPDTNANTSIQWWWDNKNIIIHDQLTWSLKVNSTALEMCTLCANILNHHLAVLWNRSTRRHIEQNPTLSTCLLLFTVSIRTVDRLFQDVSVIVLLFNMSVCLCIRIYRTFTAFCTTPQFTRLSHLLTLILPSSRYVTQCTDACLQASLILTSGQVWRRFI